MVYHWSCMSLSIGNLQQWVQVRHGRGWQRVDGHIFLHWYTMDSIEKMLTSTTKVFVIVAILVNAIRNALKSIYIQLTLKWCVLCIQKPSMNRNRVNFLVRVMLQQNKKRRNILIIPWLCHGDKLGRTVNPEKLTIRLPWCYMWCIVNFNVP